MRRIMIAAAALAAAGCSNDVAEPPAGAPSPVAEWRATHVRDLPMPDAIYVFDPDTIDGEPASVHFIVDSARLVIRWNGTYEHRVWVSEWSGQPGGPPKQKRYSFHHGDHGVWTRNADALEFESNWLQNHRMSGALGEDGVLRMVHGFSHGDPPVAIRYGR